MANHRLVSILLCMGLASPGVGHAQSPAANPTSAPPSVTAPAKPTPPHPKPPQKTATTKPVSPATTKPAATTAASPAASATTSKIAAASVPKPAHPPVVEPPKPEPPKEAPKIGPVTGLPLPRFAALRSDDVNLRVGPGTRYPISWVYKRRELPVQIEREYEVWRLVKDPDGNLGWVHQANLIGRRTFILHGETRTMRRSADDAAAAVAVLKPGVVGRLLNCAAEGAWCEVQVGDYRGYLRRDTFWGTFPGEAVN